MERKKENQNHNRTRRIACIRDRDNFNPLPITRTNAVPVTQPCKSRALVKRNEKIIPPRVQRYIRQTKGYDILLPSYARRAPPFDKATTPVPLNPCFAPFAFLLKSKIVLHLATRNSRYIKQIVVHNVHSIIGVLGVCDSNGIKMTSLSHCQFFTRMCMSTT